MAEAQRYEYIVNRSQDFITLINREYVYDFVNDSYCKAIGRHRDEVVNHSVAGVWGKEKFAARIQSCLDQCFAGNKVDYIEAFRFGDFEKHLHVSYYPYAEDGGDISHALVFSHDVTRLTEIETKLTHYEYLDPLTGLFNRRSLRIVLDKEIYKAQRARSIVNHAVLFISLQGFAHIHQTHGAEFADLILENTGLRVKHVVRDSDYVFRFDGSDLTVLLTSMTHTTDAAIVAEKIHGAITMPYSYQGIDVQIDATIGVASFPADGEDSATLIRNATSAVVEAGRKHLSYLLYDDTVHEKAIARVALKSELHHAFENREFVLHYQPFVNIDGEILGAEALIRWNHPTRGLLYPASFIGIAEETRIISAIDKWALYEVCRQLDRWTSYPGFFISINISARDLLDQYLPEVVAQALESCGNVDPPRIKLELTERISMDDPAASISAMKEIDAMGVEIWIDDFGTGQSSLSYLKHLPARILKIDKVFIDEIEDNPKDLEYLSSIVRAIRSRDKQIVIEGVSTPQQVEHLRSMNCSMMQGFHFSKGLPADALEAMLSQGVRLPIDGQSPL